jgi:hypothetical protein
MSQLRGAIEQGRLSDFVSQFLLQQKKLEAE